MGMDIERIVAEMRQKIASRPAKDEYDFSETEYLDLYPDVRSAVAAGAYRSGYEHWIESGRMEGRRGRKSIAGTGAAAEAKSMPALRRSSLALEEMRLRALPPHLFDSIGQPTPLLNTMRGRLSHAFMRWMGKALWWYTFGLKQALEKVAAYDALRTRALEAVQQDLRESNAKVETMRQEVEAAVRAGTGRIQALQQGCRELAVRQDLLESRIAEVTKIARENGTIHIPNLASRVAEVTKIAHENGTIHIPNLARRVAAMNVYANQTRAALSVQERHLALLQEAVRNPRPEMPTEALPPNAAINPGDDHAELYLDFEAAFRGSPDEIRQRQSIYIPILRDAGAGQSGRQIVDLGCGRGEWLELLRAEAMEAQGVDSNASMVETSRSLGLDVTLSDAVSFLRGMPDSSAGAVTAFHVVEHLPFEVLLALIDESIRVLKPDGVLILETPNPGNILVGAQYFYLDPTHVRPLPSPMLRFFVEARGLRQVEVLELHPYPDDMRVPENGNELAKRFNDYFYGPRDYAVIARRP